MNIFFTPNTLSVYLIYFITTYAIKSSCLRQMPAYQVMRSLSRCLICGGGGGEGADEVVAGKGWVRVDGLTSFTCQRNFRTFTAL